MNIQKALTEFITFGAQRDAAIGVLVATADSESCQYQLTTPVLIDVLTRCLNNEINVDDLALWANVIDARKDIDCAAHEGIIYALSNSEQMGELDQHKLAKLVALLRG